MKWRQRNEHRNSPYWWRVTIQIWVVFLIGWSKFPIQFGQSEAASSVWNFCAYLSDVILWETSGGVTKFWLFSQATAMLAILTCKLQVIIEGLYAEVPCQKGNELSNEALQLRCGRNDCKQGILVSQAKGHCFLWLKITWFLNVQLYM